MIIASCSAMGISMSNEINIRCRAIREHLLALDIMKNEIQFRNTPLEDIIALIEKNCSEAASKFYKRTYKLASEGMTFASAALENYSYLRSEGLANEDIEILRQVCMSLGRYDGGAQTKALNNGMEALKKTLVSVKEDTFTKGRLYRAVCTAAGVVLVLMII